MSENILPQTPAPSVEKSIKHRVSVISVLLTIVLTIVLVILGERILYDINRSLNPAYDRFGFVSQRQFVPTAHATVVQPYDDPVLPTGDPTPKYSQKNYETYRLLLHTGVVIPFFLLTFLFYYLLKFKRQSSPYQIVSWAYLIFAFWMVMHLLGELGLFMVKHYQTLGVYLVLGLLVIVFTALIIIIQKKLHKF